jgi:hypothetical protein
MAMRNSRYMFAMTVAAIACLATLTIGGGIWLYSFSSRQTCLLNLRAERDTAQDDVLFSAVEDPEVREDVLERYQLASLHYREGALPGGRCERKVGPWAT